MQRTPSACYPTPGVFSRAPLAGAYPRAYCLFDDGESVRIEMTNMTMLEGITIHAAL